MKVIDFPSGLVKFNIGLAIKSIAGSERYSTSDKSKVSATLYLEGKIHSFGVSHIAKP